VSPILGVFASANQGQFISYPAFESIATVSVGGGGAASAEFTSIPSTYTHLQIRGIPKAAGTANIAVNGLVQFNSDTGSNYSRHLLDGNGSVGTATGSASQSSIVFCPIPDSNISGSANTFAGFVMDILDYANTNKNKTVRTLSGYDLNDATYGALRFYSGLWMNTNAITSIKFYADGVNLAQYSHFALYGIKG
jgi:hypothetical protein